MMLLLFNNYKNTIVNMMENIFKIRINGEGYLQAVFGLIAVIAVTIILLFGSIGVALVPLIVHYKFVYSQEKKLNRLKEELRGYPGCVKGIPMDRMEKYNELISERDKLKVKVLHRRIKAIIAIVMVYLPIVIPIILIVGDVIVGIGIPLWIYIVGLLDISLIILGLYLNKLYYQDVEPYFIAVIAVTAATVLFKIAI